MQDDRFLSAQFFLHAGAAIELSDEPPERTRLLERIWRANAQGDDSTFLLDRYFTVRNLAAAKAGNPDDGDASGMKVSITPDFIFQYAHHLKRTAVNYYSLHNSADSRFPPLLQLQFERLRRLGWIWGSDALVLAALELEPPDDQLEPLLARIERLLFFQSLRIAGLARAAAGLLSDAVALQRREKSLLEVSDRIHSRAEREAKRFSVADSVLRMTSSRGFYGWRGVKYFLFEYEQELKRASRSNRDKLIWEDFVREDYETDYATVEHIYPQNARHGYWTQRFTGLTQTQRDALRNSLGNLLAVSRAKNASLSNRPFPDKRDGTLDAPGYRVGSYSEIEISSVTDWTPDEILERGLRLLQFLEKRWGVPLGKRSTRIASLNLRFMDSSAAGKGSRLEPDGEVDFDFELEEDA